ncbi:MAG: hypothetical protein QM811_15175 [Pirellulales bacterium]
MSAERFLDLLQTQKLIPEAVIGQLRNQLAKSTKPIPAQAVAKALIDKHLLSNHQATQLLNDLRPVAVAATKTSTTSLENDVGLAPLEPTVKEPAKPAQSKTASSSNARVVAKPADPDEFGLAPFESNEKTPIVANTATAKTKPTPAASHSNTVAQPKPTANPTAKPPTQPAVSKPGDKKSPEPARPKPIDDDPLFGGGMDDLFGGSSSVESTDPLSDAGFGSNDALSGFGDSTTAIAPVAVVKKETKPRSAFPWKPLVVAAAGFAVIVVGLTLWLLRDNGDGAWAEAKKRYDETPAEAVADLRNFQAAFPGHAKAGTAAVYLASIEMHDWNRRSGDAHERAKRLRTILHPLVVEPDLADIHPVLIEAVPRALAAMLTSADTISTDNNAARDEIAGEIEGVYRLAADPRVVPYDKRNWRTWGELEERTAQLLRERSRVARWTAVQSELIAAPDSVRDKLNAVLREYPELATDAAWKTAAAKARSAP